MGAAFGGDLDNRDLDNRDLDNRGLDNRGWDTAGFDGVVDGDAFEEAHEINVTPFIDVMLVLLIVFMVAAPLSTVDLPVDLPTSTAVPQKRPDKPLYVTVKADLAVAVGETPVKRIDLVHAIDLTGTGDPADRDRRIFLRADRGVPYGELMDVLEILRAGGYARIALVALEGVPGPSLLVPPSEAGSGR